MAMFGVLMACLLGLAALPGRALAQAAPTTTVSGAVSPDYRLGAGDVVRISVYQNADLTLEVRVAESGTVSYPLIGSLQLGGRTVSQAEALVAEGLRRGGYVKEPQVSVLVLQVRGNQANVLGQVNRPGRYPLEVAGMRLTDLLALAGGTKPEGSDAVVVIGQRDGKPFRIEVDLPTIFGSADPTGNLLVHAGDNIYVNRAPRAYVYGEVQSPGAIPIVRGYPLEVAGVRLTDLLALAGGAKAEASDTVVVTGQRDGRPFRTEVDLPTILSSADPTGNLLMQDGDNIFVKRAPRAYIYGEVQRPGAMPIVRGMTVLQGLVTGGGLSARGTERDIRLSRTGEGGRVEILTPKPTDLLRDGDVIYVRESLF